MVTCGHAVFAFFACLCIINFMIYDLIIIGGGAAGLFAAIKAKLNNKSVLVLEHTSRAAKKILSTGNGKCNLTNSYCKVDLFGSNPEGLYPYFSSGNKEFIEKVISRFDADDTIRFFESLGVALVNKNGYIYPRSEQASTINDVLRMSLSGLGVDVLTEVDVKTITTAKRKDKENVFCVNSQQKGRNVLIAAGGSAASKTGSDGSGFKLAKALGHDIILPGPALCGVKCKEGIFKELSGVRCDCKVNLTDEHGNTLISSHGNVQFTSYGLSGIPIFQISSEVGKYLKSNKKIKIAVDLIPDMDEEKIISYIEKDAPWKNKDNQIYDSLTGLLNKKIVSVLHKINGDKIKAGDVAHNIKKFTVTPVGLNSLEEAQTCSGGVNTEEIDPYTMQSRIVPGLYFAGEIIDVNGICGGYNLQWAWSTAHIVSVSI